MLDYTAPSTVEEAVRILAAASGTAKVLAGGTDLLVQLRSGRVKPGLIVDIKKIPEISGIREKDGGFVIGAATSGAMIGECEALQKAWPGVVEATNLIGSTQVQGRASLAGNLCNASPAADSVPAMIAARATCVVAGPKGRREVQVESIATGPGRTSLSPGEFIVEFHLPKRPPRSAEAYLRFIPRTEMDIAVVGAAVNLTLDAGGVCTDARVVLGAVAPTAVIVPAAAAALVGRKLDETALAALDQAARAACNPIDDKRGTIEYRTKVAGVLARRAATIAYERAGESMSKHHITTIINGEPTEFLCEPQLTLLDVLRDQLDSDRQQRRLQLGRLRRLQRVGRRPLNLFVPDARGRGRRPQDRDHRRYGEGRRASPAATDIPQGSRAAMRLLYAGRVDRGQGTPRPQSESDGNRDALLARRQPVPLHRLRQDHPRRT